MKTSKKIAVVDDYMTYSPHTVNSGVTLQVARDLMKRYSVRHLPVQVAGHLVGIVTDRDLKFAMSFDKEGKLLVDDVMTPDPFTVAPGTPLGEVVGKMATNRYGSALVQQEGGRVIGIFTAVDGLRAISEKFFEKTYAKKRRAPTAAKRATKTVRSAKAKEASV